MSLAHASDVAPEEFASNLISTLENPSGVWGKIFDNLSLMGRRVLQAVATLPTETLLGDVMAVVRHIWPNDFDPGEFSNALRMLEGTFINIDEATPGSGNQQRLVTIRDPSVRDYLWSRFKVVAGEADMLLDGAIFFEQCVILYEGASHSGSVSNRLNPEQKSVAGIQRVVSFEKVVSRATELFASRSPVIFWNWDHGELYCEREPMNLERRAEFLASISVQHQENLSAAEAVISALETLANRWGSGQGDPADALRMLRQADRALGTLDRDALKRAERCLLDLIASRAKVMEDFEVLAGLVTLDMCLFEFPGRTLQSWASDFEAFLDDEQDWLIMEIDDLDQLVEIRDSISDIAKILGADTRELDMLIEDRIDELRQAPEPDFDEYMPGIHSDPEGASVEEEVDALFSSLR